MQRGLRPTLQAELVEDRADVRFHGFFGDPQPPGDFLVCKTFRDHLEDLQFPSGQMFRLRRRLHLTYQEPGVGW